MEKSKITLLSILSLFFSAIGYVLSKSYGFDICFNDKLTNTYDSSCHVLYSRIGNPLFYGMGALAIVFLILIFTPNAVSAWKKFAKWYIPIATIIFILYPQPGSGDFFSPYPEQVFRWLSTIYILVSIFIIALRARASKF